VLRNLAIEIQIYEFAKIAVTEMTFEVVTYGLRVLNILSVFVIPGSPLLFHDRDFVLFL
jgi:hypothetical protein